MALDRFGRSVLKIDYEFDGGTTLRSVSGYQKGRTEYRADLDGTSVGSSTFGDAVDETIYSQEINLISPDTGPFKWVLGAYYQNDEYDLPAGRVLHPPSDRSLYLLPGTNPKETSAAFGQVSFRCRLGSRAAARRALLRQSNDQSHLGEPVRACRLRRSRRRPTPTPPGKVALNWTVDARNFLYAFVATGYRPGGLNVPVGLGLPPRVR